MGFNSGFKGLKAELNPICYLLASLGAHHILHVSRIRVNNDRKTSKHRYYELNWAAQNERTREQQLKSSYTILIQTAPTEHFRL